MENRSPFDDRIISILERRDVSRRLSNAIKRADLYGELPIRTLSEYMQDSDRAYCEMRKIPNLGEKSVLELHEILIKEYALVGDEVTTKNKHQVNPLNREEEEEAAIKNGCEAILKGLLFPRALYDEGVSTRLENVLASIDVANIEFSSFLGEYQKIKEKCLNARNCGRKTLVELEKKTLHVIESRLLEVGLPERFSQSIFIFLKMKHFPENEKKEFLAVSRKILKETHSLSSNTLSKECCGLAAHMRQLLEKLNQREIDVLRQRYGFDGVEPSTLEEVAFRHDVTRERVRQLQKKAIEKIGSRKNLRKLRALIEDEDVIGKIFSNRKLVPWSRVKDLLPELSTEEKLAIDVVYGSLREFLEEEALSNEMGWSIDEGEVDYGAEIEELNQSLRSRILNLLNRMALPIHLSYLDQRIPDYSKQAIREEMEDKFAATFNQGVLAKAPKLPAMTRFTLVLRQAGRGLHCEEIRAKNYELFGRDDSIHAIGGALGRSRDALIVGRGTYDLYENIALDEDRMKEIRERAYAFLREKEQYISTKVIFAEIFQGESSRFGRDFSHFMLLGLLQDDDRFDVRRGMMIGLKKFTPEQGFIRLQDEIVKIVEEAHGPVTVRDIMEELEGRREIFHSTVSGFLDSLACIVRVSRGRYDLTSIVIGDHEQQRAVVTASQIALAGGGKTTFALSEALESVGYFLTPTVLKSFLSKQGGFELHPGDMVKIRRLPDEVRAYDAAIRECIAAEPGVLDSRERLRQRVTERGAKDLTRYDPRPRFGVGEYGPDSDGEAVLNKILSNFGL